MNSSVNGTATTHKLIHTVAPGSMCAVSVMAVFGINSSNPVTSFTNTTSAGTCNTCND